MILNIIVIGLLIFIIWQGSRYLPTIIKNQAIAINNQITIAKNLNEMEKNQRIQRVNEQEPA